MSDKKRYRDIHGTTRVGDFLRSIKGVAPEILKLASNIPGLGALDELSDAIKGTDSLTAEQKDFALKQMEMDRVEMEEITKRWQSDMTSDSWLSKNVRPLLIMFLTFMMTVFIFVDSISDGFEVKDDWISLLSSLLLLVFGAYFGGRSLEKIQKIRRK